MILWSVCDACAEVVKCLISHTIWEKTGNCMFLLCLYLCIHFQMRLWALLRWCAEVVFFWGDMTLIASFDFLPYISIDFERRPARKLSYEMNDSHFLLKNVFDNWLSSPRGVVSCFFFFFFHTVKARACGITETFWPFREEPKVRGRRSVCGRVCSFFMLIC